VAWSGAVDARGDDSAQRRREEQRRPAGGGGQAVARAGLDAEVLMIPGAEIPEAAERAAAAGRVLVAAGGDGTVSTVAAVAVRTGSDLGVLPLGTLNHFARDAGIPMDVDGAVDALVDGSITLVDVCEVNDRTFVNNASLGAYPAIVWDATSSSGAGEASGPDLRSASGGPGCATA
jgi:diacylglycerol kinase family enzyme